MSQIQTLRQCDGQLQLGRHQVGLIALADISSHFPTRGPLPSLAHLAQSIERYGLLTPLLVEHAPSGGPRIGPPLGRTNAETGPGMSHALTGSMPLPPTHRAEPPGRRGNQFSHRPRALRSGTDPRDLPLAGRGRVRDWPTSTGPN